MVRVSAGAAGAGISIHNEKGTEERDKNGWKGRDQQLRGLASGQMESFAEPKKALAAGISRCVTQITDKLSHVRIPFTAVGDENGNSVLCFRCLESEAGCPIPNHWPTFSGRLWQLRLHWVSL